MYELTTHIEDNWIGKLIILDEKFNVDRYIHGFDGIILDKKVSDDDDDEDSESEDDGKYDAGADFMDNYLTGDILSMGSKWFNLPTVSEVDKMFRDEMKIKPYKRFSVKRVINKIMDRLDIVIK